MAPTGRTEAAEHLGGGVWRHLLRVPMRDGVVLAADLYAPEERPGPRPVILERTPYGRRDIRESDRSRHDEPVPTPEETSAFFVRAGYHVVRQDCRGRATPRAPS